MCKQFFFFPLKFRSSTFFRFSLLSPNICIYKLVSEYRIKMLKSLNRLNFRRFSTSKCLTNVIDWEYYTNPENLKYIADNVRARKINCDLLNVLKQLGELQNSVNHPEKCRDLKETLSPNLVWFPNTVHPKVLQNKSEEPVLIKKVGKKTSFSYFPASFEELTKPKHLNLLRTKQLGHMTGNKSYYLKGDLAMLEQALIRFAIKKLVQKNFTLVCVPDIVPRHWVEGCGMKTQSEHSQVYHIDESWGKDLCLSGTSEIALASYVASKNVRATAYDYKSLPMKFCAVSRCHRAEAKRHQKEKGIFRVHNFNKVEMFGITANESSNESEELLNEFTSIQEELYTELGLYFRVLEMPPNDLGLPAYHKYDMEAWIPTQKLFGEISSASNCTDYQSRRLNINYRTASDELKLCHTVNGTAVAIPRMLITIFENFQLYGGSISVPKPLQEYMGKDVIDIKKDKLKEVLECTKPTK